MAIHLKDPAPILDLEELLDAPSVYIQRGKKLRTESRLFRHFERTTAGPWIRWFTVALLN